ncbi:transmembrane protein 267 [Rhinatrema bivittatum]|uniref:transmembrane protein 267 n=1 Tax=Rhinatrema bivittatum TaxID=194408 RepID=UPI00112D4141|nr:transmembrane protein 267 [Rhinatrema bivittatum]XP_029433669.1 transmembrane protein 267 [Rhinatrema bivittatum]XP_029433676.1 transmembrane protein 267 [Rhinatrema bivittatum]
MAVAVTTETEKAYTLLQTFSTGSVLASLGLGLFCVLADRLLQLSYIQQNDWLRAISDNTVHGLVGMWSWAIVIGLRKKSDFGEVTLAGFFASVIDVDHFCLAGSLSLKAALHLPQRPPLHCTTLIPVVAVILKYIMQIFRLKDSWCFLPWMIFISWTSHHVRDGIRHGLWICPFGETAPLPYWLYVAITASLPHLCSFIMYLTGTRELMSVKHGIQIDV